MFNAFKYFRLVFVSSQCHVVPCMIVFFCEIFQAITGDKIVMRCEKIRNTLESCLSQLQNLVPTVLAAQIYKIVDDLRIATFTVESSENEAGEVVLALLHQDMTTSTCFNEAEFKAFRIAALRLHMTSPLAILIEKRSIKIQLEKIRDSDRIKKKILNYLLYLLRKYGKSITALQTEFVTQNEKPLKSSMESALHAEEPRPVAQADVFDALEPPDEFICPLSMRLMFDPVVIANGQTFERLWIEKWFNESNVTCPKTHTKLFDLSMTPNSALKDLISKWCMERGITVPDPSPEPTTAPLRLQNFSSSSSIASFGSSLRGLHLQVSNLSLRSSDTNYSLHPLDANSDDGRPGFDSPQRDTVFHRYLSSADDSHGINLSFLNKLAALPWSSQCKAVEDVKNQLKDDQISHSMSYIRPLISFLKVANGLYDSKAQRDGAQLLLIFLKKWRSKMPPLPEDAFYMLSSFLDSEITEEALAIFEVLSSQEYCKAEIVASGVLLSILKILENEISESHLSALKILCNLSADGDIGYHMIYLDYIPKLAPFLGDRILAGYCIKILKNLCNIEDAGVTVAENDACMTYIGEQLEIGTDEDQELVMDFILSLCIQNKELCELVMKESIVSSVVSISINGKSRGKEIAINLLQLLKDFSDDHAAQECPIAKNTSNPDVFKESSKHPRDKKSSSKASGLMGRKISIFSKTRR
ncbi:unnamed protein product [Ilex paraguariensis]|uniref:RING-type E3 ubiquitin transferase n=1 Tax=Ilex paraguariensis TaxID=185542 RepID=A0ABC8U9S1_9AQUA